MENKVTTTVEPDGSTATVFIDGALTIESSGDFHRELAEALKEAQRVVLNASGLEQIDITSLQVICSACKTASSRKVSFVLEGEAPECLISLSREIGAGQNLPYCCQDSTKHCIWYGGVR